VLVGHGDPAFDVLQNPRLLLGTNNGKDDAEAALGGMTRLETSLGSIL